MTGCFAPNCRWKPRRRNPPPGGAWPGPWTNSARSTARRCSCADMIFDCAALRAVALTDTGNLHGAAEFALAARQAGIKPILGAEIRIDGQAALLYVESSRGYPNLCQLLSRPAAPARNETGPD